MISNLILLTGADDYRLRKRSAFYQKAFAEKYPEGIIEFFTADETLQTLENSVLTPSLFGQKRLIFCEGFWEVDTFEKAIKTGFFDKLPDFSDLCTIICLEGSLDKRKKSSKFLLDQAKVEMFEALDENALLDWMIRYAADHGGFLTLACAKKLLNRCGESLWNLSQEISKLISAVDDGKITEILVETITIPHPKMLVWDFLESLSKKNVHKSISQFRTLIYMGESVHQIFAMIIREIRIHTQLVAGISDGLSSKEIAQATALHPFVVQKTLPLSRNFTLDQLAGMYDDLLEIDRRMKTGGMYLSTDDQTEFELAIEKFIVKHGAL